MKNYSFYVDTCIYLNLWKKEKGGGFGIPHWKIAKAFIEKLETMNSIIYYSGYLLKELKIILTEQEFNHKKELFESSPNFRKIKLSKHEFLLARKIENNHNFKISFYDIIHLILAKKTKSILITRDKKLLKFARRYSVVAKKPEDIL